MNEITNISSNEISMTPVILAPVGKTATLRVQSILGNSDGIAALALITQKGTIGKVARERAGSAGMVNIVRSCASSNYRPLVEYLVVLTNSALVVRNRAEYEFLPTVLDMQILNAEAKCTASGEKLAAKLRTIKAELVEIMAATAAAVAKRQAEAALRVAEEA